MSYFLTEEQALIQAAVHEFCQNPENATIMHEESMQPGIPWKTWKLLVDQGYIGMSIPVEYGGQGLDLTTELLVLETLGLYGCPCIDPIGGHSLAMAVLKNWGTEEQKKKYLVPLASGEKLGAGGMTDPSGATNWKEWSLNVEEDGDSYILTGQKVMVTNAHASSIKIIFDRNPEGTDVGRAFILEAGMPGLTTGAQENRVANGSGDWGTIQMDHVRIPKENMLDGSVAGTEWMSYGYMQSGLFALSMAECAFQMALGFTTQRTKNGKPVAHLQSVAHRLVNMAIGIETSRNLIYNSARLYDEGRWKECVRLGSMCKAYCTETGAKIVHDATILHGGFGNTVDSIVSTINPLVRSVEIAEAVPDSHRDIIAETYGIPASWK